MALLGIQNPDVSPPTARAHVLNDIKAALQLMQLSGDDFFSRTEATLRITAGTAMYELESGMQTILEPVRLSGGQSLIELRSRSQLDNFGPLFLGSNDAVSAGTPLAYFVEPLASGDADTPTLRMHITPTPAENDTITLNVIEEAPTYTTDDLLDDADTVPPVPHKYHESILLPLVRKNVTACDLFVRNAAKLPAIDADYQRALTMLGLADPRTTKGSKVDLLRGQPAQQQQGAQ